MLTLDPTKLCQIEIKVRDLQASLDFYREVFGWHVAPCDIHEITVLDVPEECGFGISLIEVTSSKKFEQSLVVYFAHEEPHKIAANVEAWGGQVRFGPKRLPGYGSIYQIEDPSGVRFGVFEPR